MAATTAEDTTFQKENFGLTRDEYNRALDSSNMSEQAFREILEANQQREATKTSREIVKNVNELKGENPYSLLQEGAQPGEVISPNSSDEQIKKAIRTLSNKYHPDKNPGDKAAEEKFKQVNSAKELLGSSTSREQFDAWSRDHPDAFTQAPPQEEPKTKTQEEPKAKAEPEPEPKSQAAPEAEPRVKPEPEPHSTAVGPHTPENAAPERVGGGINVGMAAYGVITDSQNVVQDLKEGDYKGAALSGASLGVNTVNVAHAVEEVAPGVITKVVNANIPTFKKAAEAVVEKAAPLVEKMAAPVLESNAAGTVTKGLEAVGLNTGKAVLGAAGTTLVGATTVYQAMKEDEGENRAQKAADGIVIVGGGTATGAIMSGGLVLGEGVAATGGLAVAGTVAAVAAPVVVVAELAYADKLIMDTTHIYTEQDGIFKSQQDLGHLKVMVSQMRGELAQAGVDVDKHGNIDLSDEKNRAVLNKLLMERNAKDGETMQKNDSILPRAFRSDDSVDAYNTAKSDQDFTGAAQDELRHLNTALRTAKTDDDKTKVLADAKVKTPPAPEVAAAPAADAAAPAAPAATTAATPAAATTPAASTTGASTGAPAADDDEPGFMKSLKSMFGVIGEIIGAILMAISGMFNHHDQGHAQGGAAPAQHANNAQSQQPTVQHSQNQQPTAEHDNTPPQNAVHTLSADVLKSIQHAAQGAIMGNQGQGQHVENDATLASQSLSNGPSAKAFTIT